MYNVKREFWFSAAHRVEGHPKCGRLHGHNYKVEVTLESATLNGDGMVMDFGLLDEIAKPIIDGMDHRYLVSRANYKAGDPYALIAEGNSDAYVLDCEQSTAEELANYILNRLSGMLLWPTARLQVTVQETPRNTATYEG